MAIILLAVGACWLIWKLFKKKFATYSIGTDEAEFIPLVNVLERSDQKAKKHLDLAAFGKTNNDLIRKYYYRLMLPIYKHSKNNEINACTPKELAVRMAGGKEEERDLGELTIYYEKARYGNEICSNVEVECSKDLAEKLRIKERHL